MSKSRSRAKYEALFLRLLPAVHSCMWREETKNGAEPIGEAKAEDFATRVVMRTRQEALIAVEADRLAEEQAAQTRSTVKAYRKDVKRSKQFAIEDDSATIAAVTSKSGL